MAKCLNKVMILGNVGADPKISMTSNSNKVAAFSVATTSEWRDQLGNKQSKTEWHHIVAWQWVADIVESYVRKGKQLYIEGHLQTRSYTDKNNVERQITEIVATEIILLGGTGGFNNYPSQDISGQQNDVMFQQQPQGFQQQGGFSQRNNGYGAGGYGQQGYGNNYNGQRVAGGLDGQGMQQSGRGQMSGSPYANGQMNNQINNQQFNNRPMAATPAPTVAGLNGQQGSFAQRPNPMMQPAAANQGIAQTPPVSPMGAVNQNVQPATPANPINASINDEEDIPF